MFIQRLSLRRFRNLTDVELRPSPRFNVIAGPNGQGKTNLLEGLYWLATLRPIRAVRLAELVRWGDTDNQVSAEIARLGLIHRVDVSVRHGERVARREGKKTTAAGYFGALAVVLFTPDDVGLVRGPRSDRRRYLDRAIFTGRPMHLAVVNEYRRALDGRNSLLRSGANTAVLAAYEQAMAPRAAELMHRRSEYVQALSSRFVEAFDGIIGEDLAVVLRYRPNVVCDAPINETLANLWGEDRERDAERGFTQRGPHADDIEFRFLGRSARTYASQGQQRAMVLALKIAEIQLLAESALVRPVLLLDDVTSELDADRNASLFEFLDTFDGQVFITTTDPAYLRISGDAATYHVSAGKLSPASRED